MLCPSCKNVHAAKKVIRTWTLLNGAVKRKRICSRCKHSYHTIERVVNNGAFDGDGHGGEVGSKGKDKALLSG